MISIITRDFRDGVHTWLSAAVLFVVIGFSTSLLALMCESIVGSRIRGDLADGLWGVWGTHVTFTAIIGLVVLAGTLSHLFDERSEMLARLALGGATPGQCRIMFMGQALIAGVVGTAVGALFAWVALPTVCRWCAAVMSAAPDSIMPIRHMGAVWIAAGIVMTLMMLGTWLGSRHLVKLGPSALVSRADGWTRPRFQWLRALWALLLAGGLIALVWATVAGARDGRIHMGIDSAVPAGMGIAIWGAVALAASAPWIITAPMRWAVAHMPMLPVMRLAFGESAAHPDTTLSQVNSLMLVIAMPLGTLVPAWTLDAQLRASGMTDTGVHADIASMMALCGLPLLIAVAGSFSGLVIERRRAMASAHRIALAGATPRQIVWCQCAQAMYTVLVAGGEALCCIALGSWWTACMLQPLTGSAIVVIPWGAWAAMVAVLMVLYVSTAIVSNWQRNFC